ncbi:hypothetical protein GCM10010230_24800 [Streptomyces narbonensis]|uniref:hypothetical protein n=1 Tax=Streptomyces narbonensis TaxID=67333 RepID=UPI0016739E04|nr:hypothetical protein [Streptomyces narbonensis]GGV99214.1 hypothetical protein GCM10010230_24800 [Streptomyces narbonensis]
MRTHRLFRAGTGLGLLLMLTLFAQVLVLPTTAQAHGDTVKVVVTGQRDGHVTTEITWENDGDAVDEAVAATVNAASPDGSRSMGPWPLVRDPGSRTSWSTAEVLTPGTWKVTVDVGFPALGHGDAEISVPAVDPSPPAPRPTPTTPAPVPTTATDPAPSAPAPAPSPPSSSPAGDRVDRTAEWTVAGLAGFALVGATVGLLVRRARARRR